MNAKKTASVLLKVAISVLIAAWIIRRADAGAVFQQLRNSHAGWVLLIVAATAVTNLGQVIRWYLLVPGGAGHVRFFKLLQFHMIGIFFQSFLPSSMAVELIKGYLLSKEIDEAKAYGSVAFGKIIGMIILVSVMAAVILFKPGLLPEKGHLPVAALFVCLSLAGLLVLFSKKISRRIFGFFRRFSDRPLIRLLMNFRQELYDYRFRFTTVALSGIVSVVIILSSIVGLYLSFLAVDYHVPFLICLAYFPVIYAFMMLPVSINGIGLREGLLFLFFKPWGLTPEILLSSSILSYAAIYGFCLAGGGVYVFSSIRGVWNGRQK